MGAAIFPRVAVNCCELPAGGWDQVCGRRLGLARTAGSGSCSLSEPREVGRRSEALSDLGGGGTCWEACSQAAIFPRVAADCLPAAGIRCVDRDLA